MTSMKTYATHCKKRTGIPKCLRKESDDVFETLKLDKFKKTKALLDAKKAERKKKEVKKKVEKKLPQLNSFVVGDTTFDKLLQDGPVARYLPCSSSKSSSSSLFSSSDSNSSAELSEASQVCRKPSHAEIKGGMKTKKTKRLVKRDYSSFLALHIASDSSISVNTSDLLLRANTHPGKQNSIPAIVEPTGKVKDTDVASYTGFVKLCSKVDVAPLSPISPISPTFSFGSTSTPCLEECGWPVMPTFSSGLADDPVFSDNPSDQAYVDLCSLSDHLKDDSSKLNVMSCSIGLFSSVEKQAENFCNRGGCSGSPKETDLTEREGVNDVTDVEEEHQSHSCSQGEIFVSPGRLVLDKDYELSNCSNPHSSGWDVSVKSFNSRTKDCKVVLSRCDVATLNADNVCSGEGPPDDVEGSKCNSESLSSHAECSSSQERLVSHGTWNSDSCIIKGCSQIRECKVVLTKCEDLLPAFEIPEKKQDILPPALEEDFGLNTANNENSKNNSSIRQLSKSVVPEAVILKPGKQWRRSLSILSQLRSSGGRDSFGVRKSLASNNIKVKGNRWETTVNTVLQLQPARVITEGVEDSFSQLCLLDSTSTHTSFQQPDKPAPCSKPIRVSSEFSAALIFERCSQDGPVPFIDIFPPSMKNSCTKIGEGVYGEVYHYCGTANRLSSVIKIIPIEGDMEVNGEPQKTFGEIFSEVSIAQELSNLRRGTDNVARTFNEVQAIRCVKGCYPDWLQDLWRDYDNSKGSENDCPEIFKEDQLYIVLELSNGGKDLESFIFNSADQGLAAFRQIALTLAVGEKAIGFEHRDLHWGNVLISSTKTKEINFVVDGEALRTPSKGIEVSIIDFTLSRITDPLTGKSIFYDLSEDETLFTAQGDYQFEIYRMMKQYTGNCWDSFTPKTNVAWLHYLLDKLCTMARYKNRTSKVHNKAIKILSEMKSCVLMFDNVFSFVKCPLFSL